jgi:hypothetical protein
VATLGISATSGASEPGPRFEMPLTGVHASAFPDVAGSSAYLAGYQDTPAGGLASASVTFTVPTFTCSQEDQAAGSVETNGVYTDSFSAFATVGAQCIGSSSPSYMYDFSAGSAGFNKPGAAAGDVIVASLFESSSSTWVKIHDLTNGDYWFADQPSNLGDTLVDIGTFNEVDSEQAVTKFKTALFTSATVNGDDLGFESPMKVDAFNLDDRLMTTGGLRTTAAGSAFTVKFRASM